MNGSTTILILIGFLAMSVFGLYGMTGSHSHNSFVACLGSLTQGNFCPQSGSVTSAGFHIKSFRTFSNAPLAFFAAAIFLASIFLSFLLPLHPITSSAPIHHVRRFLKLIFETSLQPFKLEKIHWNSLHENSPSIVAISFQLPATG